MIEMSLRTAKRKEKEGLYVFPKGIRCGVVEARYQTPTGKWKARDIHIPRDRSND